MSTPSLQSTTPEIADSPDLASAAFTPAVVTPTCCSSALSPLPDIAVQSFDRDDATAEPSPRDSLESKLRSPSGVSIEEQSETSPSEASQSEDGDISDDADGQLLAPPPRDSDDIDPLSSTLSLMRLHSRSTTPDPSAERRFRRTPSKIWYQVRGHDAADDDADASETCESSFPESFARSIRTIQRAQGSLDKRTTELEKELAALRSEFASSVDTSKALLMKTRESILKERRTMEKTNVAAADGLLSLEQKLARAQVSIATLQAKHSADQEAMEQMANDIAEVLAIQEDMGCRLLRLNESQQSICDSAGHTRDLLMELPHAMLTAVEEPQVAEHPGGDSALGSNLADELAATTSHNLFLSPESSMTSADGLNSSDDTLHELENVDPAPKGAFELTFVGSHGAHAGPHPADGRAVTGSYTTQDSACLPLPTSVPTASSDPVSSLEHHTLRTAAASVRTSSVFPARLIATLSDMKLGELVDIPEWIEDIKLKADMKKLRQTFDGKLDAGVNQVREKFTAYAPGAYVMYGRNIVSIMTLLVVVSTIIMWRERAVGLPASPVPDSVHVSEHPIWDSL